MPSRLMCWPSHRRDPASEKQPRDPIRRLVIAAGEEARRGEGSRREEDTGLIPFDDAHASFLDADAKDSDSDSDTIVTTPPQPPQPLSRASAVGRCGRRSVRTSRASRVSCSSGYEAFPEGEGEDCRTFMERFYKEHLVVDPRSSWWHESWEVLTCIATLSTAFEGPYQAAFIRGSAPWHGIFDHVVYLLFLADMVLQPFVSLADVDRPACVVKRPLVIISKYAKTWLLFDVIAVIPYFVYAVVHLTGTQGQFHPQTLRILGLARLLRFPRLVERLGFIRRWQIRFGFNFATLEVMKYTLVVAVALNSMACVWGGIALRASTEEHTWLSAMVQAKDLPESYMVDEYRIYSISLYWAIMTLTSVGYGDIAPQNMLEYWIASLCMGLAAALWTFIIGEVCRIAASVDPHGTRFMQNMDDLNNIMKSRCLPQSMQRAMRRYLHEAREVARQRAQTPVIEQMSPMLQGQMAMALNRTWLEKVWYLKEVEGQALVNIARRLRADFFAPGEEVASVRTLFILRRGVCTRRSKILTKGDVWGEDMVLNNQHLRDDSPCKAISYLETVLLHNVDLLQAVKGFPEISAHIQRVRVKIAIRRGIILVARGIKELCYRKEWDRDDITEEAEGLLIQHVLTGGVDTMNRSSMFFSKMRIPRKSASIKFSSKRSEARSEAGTEADMQLEMQAVVEAVQSISQKVDAMHAQQFA